MCGAVLLLPPPGEDVLEQLLGDDPVRRGGVMPRPAVQPAVDEVEAAAEVATHVEPPVAGEHRLRELRAVRAEERGLPTVQVAVVPRLAPRLRIREETRVRLVVAVEVGVRHCAQYRIVDTRPT